jgi:hypothetical protein
VEPEPAMLAKLRNKPELQSVVTVEGPCDNIGDRHHFSAAQFDVIVSGSSSTGCSIHSQLAIPA